jgi:hypothetical protein
MVSTGDTTVRLLDLNSAIVSDLHRVVSTTDTKAVRSLLYYCIRYELVAGNTEAVRSQLCDSIVSDVDLLLLKILCQTEWLML